MLLATSVDSAEAVARLLMGADAEMGWHLHGLSCLLLCLPLLLRRLGEGLR